MLSLVLRPHAFPEGSLALVPRVLVLLLRPPPSPPCVPQGFLGLGSSRVGPAVAPPPLPPAFPEGSLALVPRVLVLVSRPLGPLEGSLALVPRVLVLVFRPLGPPRGFLSLGSSRVGPGVPPPSPSPYPLEGSWALVPRVLVLASRPPPPWSPRGLLGLGASRVGPGLPPSPWSPRGFLGVYPSFNRCRAGIGLTRPTEGRQIINEGGGRKPPYTWSNTPDRGSADYK